MRCFEYRISLVLGAMGAKNGKYLPEEEKSVYNDLEIGMNYRD